MAAAAQRQVRIEIPYSPRTEFLPFHDRRQRWACLVAHRRAGKTVACINELVKGAAACTLQSPRFAYIAPFYNQAKDIAWGYVRQYTDCIPGMVYHESELRADFPGGARLRLYGGDNPDRLRGIYLDGVVMDEPADMDPRLWPEIVRPALSDRKGWAVFIGTPRGRNSFYDVYDHAIKHDDWYAAMLRASETRILNKGELDDARSMMSEAQYLQEYECSFEAAILGAYYGKEMSAAAKRVTNVPHDPALTVETWWDLGVGDATAVWFVQRSRQEIHLIDYYEENGTSLAQDCSVLQARALQDGYVYGDHVWPHDGAAREKSSAKRLSDTFKDLMRVEPTIMERPTDVMPGIDNVKNALSRCWFDEIKCARGIEALRNYRAEWDVDRKTFKPKPLHDWSSHGADAFRTGCMHRPVERRPLEWNRKGIV